VPVYSIHWQRKYRVASSNALHTMCVWHQRRRTSSTPQVAPAKLPGSTAGAIPLLLPARSPPLLEAVRLPLRLNNRPTPTKPPAFWQLGHPTKNLLPQLMTTFSCICWRLRKWVCLKKCMMSRNLHLLKETCFFT
jgi:hypothetical protein